MKIHPAPMALRNAVGSPQDYFIHAGYEVRLENEAFDDTPLEAEFQREVYEYARQLADKHKFKRILDYGCGSGFKLITNFFEFETIGIDLPDTVKFLNKRWPGRAWFTEFPKAAERPDLLICSDVIEHIPNPNELLDQIKGISPRLIILSTPERDELGLGTENGPPKNVHHVREWNFSEFHAYIASRFKIRQHFVMRGTQIAECEL